MKRLQFLALRIGRLLRQAKSLCGEEEKKETNEWIVWKEVASAWVETPQRFSFSTHDMPIWKKEKFDM